MRIIMSLVQVELAHSFLYYYIIFALRADAVIETVPPEMYVPTLYYQSRVYHAKNCLLSYSGRQISIKYYATNRPACINVIHINIC